MQGFATALGQLAPATHAEVALLVFTFLCLRFLSACTEVAVKMLVHGKPEVRCDLIPYMCAIKPLPVTVI